MCAFERPVGGRHHARRRSRGGAGLPTRIATCRVRLGWLKCIGLTWTRKGFNWIGSFGAARVSRRVAYTKLELVALVESLAGRRACALSYST